MEGYNMLKFKHDKLEARINEVLGSNEAFGQELGLSTRAINSRLKGLTEFSLSENQKAVELLNIPVNQINAYFFDVEEVAV